jgi:hypothetical protein
MRHIQFGDRVKDVVTGVEGIVIGFSRFSTGCDQFSVQQGKVSSEGKLSETLWFDRHRLTVIEERAVVVLGQPECPGPWIKPEESLPQGGPVHNY